MLLPGIQISAAGSIILTLSTKKLLVKGINAYPTYITDLPELRKDINQVSIVKEFFDVFLEKLPSMPPDREVEFLVEVAPGTAPISCAPYRMTPLELKELKKQL